MTLIRETLSPAADYRVNAESNLQLTITPREWYTIHLPPRGRSPLCHRCHLKSATVCWVWFLPPNLKVRWAAPLSWSSITVWLMDGGSTGWTSWCVPPSAALPHRHRAIDVTMVSRPYSYAEGTRPRDFRVCAGADQNFSSTIGWFRLLLAAASVLTVTVLQVHGTLERSSRWMWLVGDSKRRVDRQGTGFKPSVSVQFRSAGL